MGERKVRTQEEENVEEDLKEPDGQNEIPLLEEGEEEDEPEGESSKEKKIKDNKEETIKEEEESNTEENGT